MIDYKRAVGDPAGLAELMVFFCERAAGFCNAYGGDDQSYYNALVNMFGQALAVADTLPPGAGSALAARLDRVRTINHKFGYGVGEEMDSLLARYPQRGDRS